MASAAVDVQELTGTPANTGKLEANIVAILFRTKM
jgi:hypothetical protein